MSHFWVFLPVFVFFSVYVNYILHVFVFSIFSLVCAFRCWGGSVAVGLLYGGVYLIIFWGLGFVYGFSSSPYGGSLEGVVFNAVYFSTFALASELGRFCALSSSRRGWWPLFVSVVFAFELYRPSLSPQWVGSVAVPALAMSLTASILQLRHGVWASLPLAFVYKVLPYVSPVLPNSPWVVYGFVNVLFLLAVAVDTGEVKRGGGLFLFGLVGLVVFLVGGFGVRPYLVVTGSMSPAIEPGDVVIVAPTRDVAIGDVVAYRGDGVVLHRVVSIERGEGGRLFYITKGDANDSPDPPVPAEAVLGRVVLVLPKVGLPALWARNPADWPKLALFLMAVLLLENLLTRVRFKF